VTFYPQQIQYLKTVSTVHEAHVTIKKSSVNTAGSEIHTNYRITFCRQKLLLLNVKTGDI